MIGNVCKFVETKNPMENLNIINFVYEKKAEFKQSFIIPACYGLYVVTGGNGSLHTRDGVFDIEKGDMFFTFSSKPYFIENIGDLQYIYIMFIGLRTSGLFARLCISYNSPVYHNFDFLCDRWQSDFEKANEYNIDLICEALLLHSLSYLCKSHDEEKIERKINGILQVKQYIDIHYSEPEINLEFVSSLFNYSPKYLSAAFINLTKINFSKYVAELRMKHAKVLIKSGINNIEEISSACGYNDPQHFSKTFKKYNGLSPRDFIKSR